MTFRYYSGRRARGGSIAEFGPVMWLLLVFVLFPLFDLISFFCGVATVMLMASMGSRDAAPSVTFSNAKTAVVATEKNLNNLMQFAKLVPINAKKGSSGVSCQVIISPVAGGNPLMCDTPLEVPTPVDTGSNLYQFVVTATYNVYPLFNFNGSPVLDKIPGLGAPVPITFASTVTVEHPEGLKQ